MPLLCGSPPRRSISPSHAPGCEASNLSQNTLLIFSFHDLIHKTVCQLELGSLEAPELLADRLLDDTRTRNPISAPALPG